MAVPTYYYESVTQVTPAWLQQRAITAVLVDLDNTILPRFTEEVPAEIRAWAAGLTQARIPVALLSNNHKKRVGRYGADLGFIPVANAVKPLPFGYLRALRKLGATRRAAVMIGDQFFTDVCGAALLGVPSVMVTPLSQRDLAHTLILRKLEKFFMHGRQAVGA
ncbi:MAG: HAD hydrolase-like protein [Coriobacteriia bacterium]|nr:HAD hydrolase-like protein [Coriobacteriia bacterium]